MLCQNPRESVTLSFTLDDHDRPAHLSAHDPALRLAGPARPQRRRQRRRDPGTPPRGHRPAPPGRPAQAGLSRPRRDRRARPVPARPPAAAPDRDPRHPARLAPAPAPAQMDQSERSRAGRRSPMKSATWFSAWPGRTRAGDIAASRENSPASATASARERSGGSWPSPGSAPHHAGRHRPGGSSSPLKHPGSWPATSCTPTPSSSAASTSCS